MEPEIDCKRLSVSQTEHIPQVFDVIFLKGTSQCPCPFPGCPGSLRNYNGLRNHFNGHNLGDSLWI